MRQRPLSARARPPIPALVLLLVGCGAERPPITPEPIPATDRDPPAWTPSASVEGHTGEPVALAPSGGAEQARALFTTLVLALRDGSESAIAATLAERVGQTQVGLGRTTWTRGVLARQMLAAAAGSHVEADVPFDALVDPATLVVREAATHFEGALPPSVAPGDQVVTFVPTALGRRLLAGLGSTTLVVRPGPTPVVVAR